MELRGRILNQGIRHPTIRTSAFALRLFELQRSKPSSDDLTTTGPTTITLMGNRRQQIIVELCGGGEAIDAQ
jgi:hypothetical protein